MRETWWQLDKMRIADLLALTIFKALTFYISYKIDTLVVGFTVYSWLGVRAVFYSLKAPFFYFCGDIDDLFRAKIAGAFEHRVSNAIADGLALSASFIPVYIFLAPIFGAEINKVISAAGFFLIFNLCFGWVYGWMRDWARRNVDWCMATATHWYLFFPARATKYLKLIGI